MIKPLLTASTLCVLLFLDLPGPGRSHAQTNTAATPQASALPDALVMSNGEKVTRAEQWGARRRPELLRLFSQEMYGTSPGRPARERFQTLETDPHALGGKATRKQIRVLLSGETNGPSLELLVYLPNVPRQKHPVILGINFWGNHAIHPDRAIFLSQRWMESGRNPYVDLSSVTNHQATEATRGVNASQWPVEKMIERGYGLATFYRGDVAPDSPNGMTNLVHSLYPELQGRGDNFGTIAAWAWSLSRAMDYLETDADINAGKVAVFGWSRLGKAALWAGATDERFAMILSNESGAGGAKLFHRGVGENIRRLNTVFPHWYSLNFRRFNDQDTRLPFDQHQVIALIAPRPVYIGSAAGDKGADPEGEFAAALEADKVYRFLGTEGLPARSWPKINESVQGRIGYHVREGNHDVLDYDWKQYLDFADRHLKTARQ